jgi:hypothetical protein
MSAIRYRDGGASVELTGDLAKWAEAAIQKAAGEAIGIVRAELETVARQAEADWYSSAGVERRTGQSGQMAVTTTIDAARGVIRVSVGSSDTRRVGKKNLAPAAYVHRAGPNSVALRVVGESEYYAAPKSTRFCHAKRDGKFWKVPSPEIKAGDYVIKVQNPRASDGKKLSPIFVFAPGKRVITAALPKIGAAMAKTATATEVPRA